MTIEATPALTRMVIDGTTVEAAGGATFEIVNPATGRVFADGPAGWP